MSFRFTERQGSGSSSSNPPSLMLKFQSAGNTSRAFLREYALSVTEPTVFTTQGLLYRQDLFIDDIGSGVFHIDVPYGPRSPQPSYTIATGSWRIDFDVGGGTVHITHSLETVNAYVASGDPIDFKQAIAVDENMQPQGTDIDAGSLRFNVSYRHPEGQLTTAYMRAINGKKHHVNNDTWLGFPAGSVRFLGGRGSDGSDAEAEASYSFLYEENLTGLAYGDVTGVAKQGHDLLWVYSRPTTVSGKPSTEVLQVNVERVYPRLAFTTHFPFGG